MDYRISILWNTMVACLRREDGQDLVEYGLVIALVGFGTITGLKSVGSDISMIYSAISSTITSSTSP
ncbi:MAG: Flp family type IVb pilin [Terracidiphilus sp.]